MLPGRYQRMTEAMAAVPGGPGRVAVHSATTALLLLTHRVCFVTPCELHNGGSLGARVFAKIGSSALIQGELRLVGPEGRVARARKQRFVFRAVTKPWHACSRIRNFWMIR